MGCDAYISAERPQSFIFICYTCGKKVYPDMHWSLKEHEDCSRERNGKWVIPVNIDTTGQEGDYQPN